MQARLIPPASLRDPSGMIDLDSFTLGVDWREAECVNMISDAAVVLRAIAGPDNMDSTSLPDEVPSDWVHSLRGNS